MYHLLPGSHRHLLSWKSAPHPSTSAVQSSSLVNLTCFSREWASPAPSSQPSRQGSGAGPPLWIRAPGTQGGANAPRSALWIIQSLCVVPGDLQPCPSALSLLRNVPFPPVRCCLPPTSAPSFAAAFSLVSGVRSVGLSGSASPTSSRDGPVHSGWEVGETWGSGCGWEGQSSEQLRGAGAFFSTSGVEDSPSVSAPPRPSLIMQQ